MEIAKKPENETERLRALHSLNILDTEMEERFDRVVRLAQKLFKVPIALVSLIDADRQWFKSKVGLDATETPRDIAFCAHAILNDDLLIVEDAQKDKRFADNPFVTGNPNIRFYIGCPLKVNNQYNIGTFCIIDKKKRKFSADDAEMLQDLARILQSELESIQLSTTDELTGLSNRRGFLLVGNYIFNLCMTEKRPVTLLFFDLDHFKAINDKWGHAEGDKVLKTFSTFLIENFSRADVISRLGGDEFCVLCTGMTDAEISKLITDFKTNLAKYINEHYRIEFSVGCIHYDGTKHHSLADLLKEADQSMYENKRFNRVEKQSENRNID